MVSAENHVIATGYNGAPAGAAHQTECPRLMQETLSGSGLDLCEDVHAEENCIAQAAKYGHSVEGGRLFTTFSPCHRCARMLVNAGVREVVYAREYGDVRAFEMYEKLGLTLRRLD